MNGISPKVSNATTATGFAGAWAAIAVWGLSHWLTIPPEIAALFVAGLTPPFTLLAGYMTPHDSATQAALDAAAAAATPLPQAPPFVAAKSAP